MLFRQKPRIPTPLFTITEDELLEDLFYPGRPPGQWLGIQGVVEGDARAEAPVAERLTDAA